MKLWRPLLASLAAGTVGLAQSQPPPQFRAGTNIVVLDVSVVGRDRRPVRDLTVADFVVLENGTDRPITFFEYVDVGSVTPESSWVDKIPSDVESNDVGDRRLVVIVLDDSVDLAQNAVKRIGHEIVANLAPNDLAAVVYTVDQSKAQDYTPDRGRLHAAVDRYDRTYGFWPLLTLQNVVDYLSRVPQRRKTVFYISPGQPLDLAKLVPTGNVHTQLERGVHARILYQLQDVFRAAQRANVNIYTIDPLGLRAPTKDDPDPGRHQREFLQVLADETGGRAVVLDNEPHQRVPELLEENGGYYLIGFPATGPLDGRFRRVRVRVNRPSVQIRARTGYYARPDLMRGSSATDRRASAFDSVLPDASVPMTLSAVPLPLADGRSTVLLALGVEAPAPARETTETVRAEFAAFNDAGRLQGSTASDLGLVLRPSRSETLRYELLGRLDLRPGFYHLRVVAQVRERERRGTLFASVTVRDFAREPLALSGVVLQPSPAPPAGPREAATAILPLVPATTRTFRRGERVDALVRMTQGGKDKPQSVVLTTRIHDANGSVMFEAPQPYDANQFAPARPVDHVFTLPLSALGPGRYLLVLEAARSGGPSVKREVRFTLR